MWCPASFAEPETLILWWIDKNSSFESIKFSTTVIGAVSGDLTTLQNYKYEA